ncbi:MAG: glycoside hydrolase family 2 protein [Fimbriimonas sp.]
MLQTTYLHSEWEFAQTHLIGQKVGFSATEWLPASVPGHVHLDLVTHGIIADPHVRMNEMGCQWVDETDWSYRTKFDWTPNPDLPRRVLKFEGLDTICEVFLNGDKVAEHDNMFVPLEVDVTDLLKEGENTLEIRFQSATRVGRERQAAYFAEKGLAADTERFDERAFVRKAQYMYGWDWGPRLVSCGIWRPVSLVEFAARITDVYVAQTHRENGVVEFKITTEFEGEGQIVHRLDGVDTLVGDGSFVLHRPGLWSPEAPIRMELVSAILPLDTDLAVFQVSHEEIEDEEDAADLRFTQSVVLADEAQDMNVQYIGAVQTRLLREADEYGESFEFEVNGHRLWARGSNWIPDHSFPSIVDRTRLRDRLEKALDMGHNMLRIWGGGLYETDEFYDLCDELGILVWQDFPFACSYYPDSEPEQAVIHAEATANIKRLRNRPSLALWCGNNENHEMHFNRWGDPAKHPDHYYGCNLYDGTLPELVKALDPAHDYIPSSPIGTPPEEKVVDQKRRGPNADHYGDQHNWDVWHGRGDWRHYTDSKGRFSSEYGFASAASLACWDKVLSEEDWEPHSPVVRWHDKTGKGDDVFHGYVELHYPKSETMEDWVYYSQLNQRDALRHGVEHYRRSAFARGSLIWQLNDCWPTQSWAMLDSDGTYKALAYELRRLYADVVVSIVRENETVKVHLANDGVMPAAGIVTLQAYSTLTGELVREFEEEAEIDPDDRGVYLEGNVAGLPVPETLLVASFDDATTWQLVGEPKATRFGIPGAILASTSEEGQLILKLDGPVVDLMLSTDGDTAPFLDNFITTTDKLIAVRVSKKIDRIEARSLAGYHPIRLTRSPL